MTLFAVSDLHMGDAKGAHMFDDARQGRILSAACERIAQTRDAELILNGDIFDLTALVPPAKGLAEFAKALQFELKPRSYQSLAEMLAAVRQANPITFAALETLAARVPVTLVPGNHDRHLGEAGAREALDSVGLGHVRLEQHPVRKLDGRVIAFLHGHHWDPSNATPQGGGETNTSVIHHAVVPFLLHLQHRPNVRIDPNRIVALRPEERVFPVLERWLQPGHFQLFLDALLELLVANGSLSRPFAMLATQSLMRRRLKDDDDLWEHAGAVALGALSGERQLPGRPPPPDVLVLGHTHVLDWAVQDGRSGAQRLYVNLGTWTERASDAVGPPDVTLPLFKAALDDRHFTVTLSDMAHDRHTMQLFSVSR